MMTESSIPPPSSLEASSWSLMAMASRKSSFVHPYTMAFKKPCRGTVRDCMKEGGGEEVEYGSNKPKHGGTSRYRGAERRLHYS